MSTVRVDPAVLRGELRPPTDKSLSHRAAILGAMASEPVCIRGYLAAADTNSTLRAVERLGALVQVGADEVLVRGTGLGDAGGVAEARAGGRRVLGAQRLGRPCHEDVGHHVRQVADRGHHAVVDLGVDRRRARADAGQEPVQALEQDALRRRRRGQVPGGAVEEVLARVLDSGRLRPGERVAADEARVAPRVDHRALGRADVGHHAALRRRAQHVAHHLGQAVDGHGDERGVGAVERVAEVAMGAVDRPGSQRGVGLRVDAAHGGTQPRPRGQADRAPDEPHADDCDDQAPTNAALPATAAAAFTRAA